MVSNVRITVLGKEIRLARTPHFDIDEEALPIGVALLVQTVLRYLTSAAT